MALCFNEISPTYTWNIADSIMLNEPIAEVNEIAQMFSQTNDEKSDTDGSELQTSVSKIPSTRATWTTKEKNLLIILVGQYGDGPVN
jgi:hypothetical protein